MQTPIEPTYTVTQSDIDDLRHMLGMDSRQHGYRNYFVADPGHQGMRRLVASGLAERVKTPSWMEQGDATFRATSAGKRLVGLKED